MAEMPKDESFRWLVEPDRAKNKKSPECVVGGEDPESALENLLDEFVRTASQTALADGA